MPNRTVIAIAGQPFTLTSDRPGTWAIPNRPTQTGVSATETYSSTGKRTVTFTETIEVDVQAAAAPVPDIVVGPSEPEGKKLIAGDNFAAEAEALRAGGTLLLPYGVTYPTNRMARLKGGVTLGAYGDPSRGKPKVRTQGGVALWAADVNGGTVQDIDFASAIDPVGEAGIVIRNADGWTIRRCRISNFREGLQVQGVGRNIDGFNLLDSAVFDCWTAGDKSQGIYMSRVHNAAFRGVVFDRNGYQNKNFALDDDSTRNHNIYIQSDCGLVLMSGVVSSRASGHGAQFRSGAEVMNFVGIDNPVHMSFGYVDGAAPKAGGVMGGMKRGMFVGSGDVDNVHYGFALTLGNARNVSVDDLLVCHNPIRGVDPAIVVKKCRNIDPYGVPDLPVSQQRISVSNVYTVNWALPQGKPFLDVRDGIPVQRGANIGVPPPVQATRDAMLGPDVFTRIRVSPETAAAELLAKGYQAVGLQ
jgi:hypothetical protein